MPNWIQVGLPLCVGLTAGAMNWFAVQAELKPVAFTAVNRTVPRGEPIHAGDLVRVEIAGNARQLLRAAIPWEERSTAYSALASRELFAGDLVLLSDVTPAAPTQLLDGEQAFSLTLPNEVDLSHVFAGQMVSIQLGLDRHAARVEAVSSESSRRGRSRDGRMTLGPYRVCSVMGDNLPHLVGENARNREGSRTLAIVSTLTPSGQPESDTQRLLSAASKHGAERITAVFVRESDHRSVGRTAAIPTNPR